MSQNYMSEIITDDIDMNTDGYTGYSYFCVDCSGKNINITLPTGWSGLTFVFNRFDTTTNTLNFIPQTGDTINGGSNTTLDAKNYCEAVYLNGNWYCPRFAYN